MTTKPKIITLTSNELQKIKDACFTQGKKAGFDEGVHYIVAHVEDILCNELGFKSREELVKSGKMPAIWIAALVKAHREGYEERLALPRLKAWDSQGCARGNPEGSARALEY